jgi:hypothetical protein
MNREILADWKPKKYTRVRRSRASVQVTEEFVSGRLLEFCQSYSSVQHEQGKRLVRDVMDFLLRRFHQYAVQQEIGSHYLQQGVRKGIFEHLIPASVLRDLVLDGAITIQAAMHAPTVLLSKENDARLSAAGLTSKTKTPLYPFRRYIEAGVEGVFTTHRGDIVTNLQDWSLDDHYRLIGAKNGWNECGDKSKE